MQEQLRKEIDEVHAGSNFSNLGTQNISASKVEEAKATQTVTAHYPGGDFFSRKDMSEYDTAHGGPHGVAYTRQEQEWAKSTQAASDRGASEQSPVEHNKNQEQNSRTSLDLKIDRKLN